MADGVDTSIYKTQQSPPNPLAQIIEYGKAADALGGLAVGGAVQQGIGPDGQIDQNKVMQLLKQSTVGSMKAIPTADALQRLRQAGYAADQSGLETFQKRMAITHHLFSGLASKDKPTMGDVYDIAAQALDPRLEASKYGITMPVIMNAVKQFRNMTPEQIKKKALEIQTQAATTSEILQQHSPGYTIVDQGGQKTIVPTGTNANPAIGTAVPNTLPPTTPVATPEGNRYLGTQPPVPGGGTVSGTGVPVAAVPGPAGVPSAPAAAGPAATLRPGYTAATESVALAGAGRANELTTANDTSMTRKAMIGNLEEDLKNFTSGPGADWTRVAKAWSNRNLPVPKAWQEAGAVFDPKSIASQEQFNKQSGMLAQQQFQTIGGTGTDAKFNSAFTTNPGETLSQLGNVGIMRLLKGNEDAIQAKNTAWQKWKDAHGADTWDKFTAQFNEHFDPRVFQFKYIAPKDRQAYVDAMDSDEERMQFLHNMTYARKHGWINFEQPKAK